MKKASRQSAARTDDGKEMTTVRLPMPVKRALRRLAQKENRADIIAGVNLAAENEEVTDILIDLAQRETKYHSLAFARKAVGLLKPVTQLTGRPMRLPDSVNTLLPMSWLAMIMIVGVSPRAARLARRPGRVRALVLWPSGARLM